MNLVYYRLVIFAGDTSPVEVICHMPAVCEQKSIPYCYTPSKEVSTEHSLLLHSIKIARLLFS